MIVQSNRISPSILCSQPFHLVINDCSQSVAITCNHFNNIITYEDQKVTNILQHYGMGHPAPCLCDMPCVRYRKQCEPRLCYGQSLPFASRNISLSWLCRTCQHHCAVQLVDFHCSGGEHPHHHEVDLGGNLK